MAPFVGLTGGSAPASRRRSRLLGELGAATLSTDAVVHELLAGDELRAVIVARLGTEVAPDGELDRALVAERVFGDDEERAWLEGVLWPRVGQRVAAWRAEAAAPTGWPSSRCRCCSRPGWRAPSTRTIAVVADEDDARASARARAATRPWPSGTGAS